MKDKLTEIQEKHGLDLAKIAEEMLSVSESECNQCHSNCNDCGYDR